MLNYLSAKDKASATVKRRPAVTAAIRLGGVFDVECFDKNGRLKWRDSAHNLITNEGLNRLLDVMLHATTQTTTWYVGLFEDNHTVAAGDNYDVPGFTECTAYDEAARQAYVEAAASSQSTTNSANKATFTISATKTIYGAFLASVSTKGDHTAGADNVLLCAAQFSSSKAVEDDDTLEVTYTVSAADDGA